MAGSVMTRVRKWPHGIPCPCTDMFPIGHEAPESSLGRNYWQAQFPASNWIQRDCLSCPMCYLVWKGLSLFMTELGFEPNSDDSDETRREFNKLQIILRVPIRGSGHVTVSYIPIYGISDDDPIHRRWQLKSWELRLRNKSTVLSDSSWPFLLMR